MRYCCEQMKTADEKGFIDYCPGHLTTIDTKTEAYPIHFCPFCGAKLKGTKKSVKRIKKYFGKKRGEERRGEGGRAVKCEDEVIKELREVEKDFRGRSKEPEVMKERYLEGWRDALRWIIGEEG